jgi:hypothetical protein
MVTMNNLILLTATCTSTTLQRECIVVFPWQQRLWERATKLRYTWCKFSILFNNLEVRKTLGIISIGQEMSIGLLPTNFV